MRTLLLISVLFTIASTAWGWGDIGHATVGYLAEKMLSESGKQLVQEILGVDPLSVSATFPDHVRSDDRFDKFASLHFLEIPPNTKFGENPKLRAKLDSATVLESYPRRILDPGSTREQKMLAMRYLVHVVGDLHQPLHVGNGLDMGGNLCSVMWQNPAFDDVKLDDEEWNKVLNDVTAAFHGKGIQDIPSLKKPELNKWVQVDLHTLWDEKIIENIAYTEAKRLNKARTGKRWFGYQEMASAIINDSTIKVDAATESAKSPTEWYAESQSFHPVIYPDEDKQLASPEKRPYCHLKEGVSDAKDPFNDKKPFPQISSEYVEKASKIIKSRILLAGYRLAYQINLIAARKAVGDDSEALKTVMKLTLPLYQNFIATAQVQEKADLARRKAKKEKLIVLTDVESEAMTALLISNDQLDATGRSIDSVSSKKSNAPKKPLEKLRSIKLDPTRDSSCH